MIVRCPTVENAEKRSHRTCTNNTRTIEEHFGEEAHTRRRPKYGQINDEEYKSQDPPIHRHFSWNKYD